MEPIDRKDLIIKLMDLSYPIDIATLYELIQDMPVVQPEPPHGQWILKRYGFDSPLDGLTFEHCSCCGWEHNKNYMLYSYCPNCGAKMRK